MAKPPMCQRCGTSHWSTQPHAKMGKNAKTKPVSPPPKQKTFARGHGAR